MTNQEIECLLEAQRTYYRAGTTLPVSFRVAQLKKLYAAIEKYQEEISAALKEDLGKSRFEGFMCESGMALSEISYMIRHVRKWCEKSGCRPPRPVPRPELQTARALWQRADHEPVELPPPFDR